MKCATIVANTFAVEIEPAVHLSFVSKEADMPTPASDTLNEYRCNACGRYLNTEAELKTHETQCRVAKQATPQGESNLADEDARPPAKNDSDKRMDR